MTTILIVDDDENCAQIWARILGGLASRFLFATTLKDAFLKMAEIPPPDLILLDLKLPPHGAAHTLSAVNALREYNPELKVVTVSGMTPEETDAAIKKAGVVIQAAVSKCNMECQSSLLRVVQDLLKKSPGLEGSTAILETVSEVIAKKQTDRIQLPE
jgi:CheY-like chemotaxis protein